MRRLKPILNHPSTEPFIKASGQLMLNLGFIEAQTYEWIRELQLDSMVAFCTQNQSLSKRISIVREMIRRAKDRLTEESRAEFVSLWGEAGKEAKFRNTVAHNPVGLGFESGIPSEKNASIGLLNMKPDIPELVSVEDINNHVNATARIAIALSEALEALSSTAA